MCIYLLIYQLSYPISNSTWDNYANFSNTAKIAVAPLSPIELFLRKKWKVKWLGVEKW